MIICAKWVFLKNIKHVEWQAFSTNNKLKNVHFFQFNEEGKYSVVAMTTFAGRSFLGLGSVLTDAKVDYA